MDDSRAGVAAGPGGASNFSGEMTLDALAALAAAKTGAPISTISIIDPVAGVQRFEGQSGLPPHLQETRCTDLVYSVCYHVKTDDRVVCLPDTREDPLTAGNALLEAESIVSYVGVPVYGKGEEPLGALCLMDQRRRDWSAADIATLKDIARSATHFLRVKQSLSEIEWRRAPGPDTDERRSLSDRRLALFGEAFPGVMFEYVLYPDGTDELEYMSPGCRALWGVSAAEACADVRSLWQLVDPDSIPDLVISISRSAHNLSRWQHRWKITTRAGDQRWVEVDGMPERRSDGATVWSAICMDATEKVRAQEDCDRTRNALALAQKRESVGRLAGGFAHDFNNLLAIVIGNADLALEEDPPENVRKMLENILSAAERGRDVTSRVLTFAQKAPLSSEDIDVNAAVEDISAMVERAIPAHITLCKEITPDLPAIQADRIGLESALLNLIRNAQQAVLPGGHITIRTGQVTLTEKSPIGAEGDTLAGDYVTISVEDDGPGIPPDLRQKIFDPFFSTRGPDEGSGLGLSMVQGFCRQTGGSVTVENGARCGACLRMYLPLRQAAMPEATYPVPRLRNAEVGTRGLQKFTPRRILLVEDNADLREVTRRSLEAAGHTVIPCDDGEEALATFEARDTHPDLVLTDVVMPGKIQGPHLMREIRKNVPGLPIILMTGYITDYTEIPSADFQGSPVLMKPVSRDVLLATVDRVTAG